MVGELFLMASHGYPPGLGVFAHQEQGFSRGSKDLHHFLHYHSSNQDLVNSHLFNLRLQQKEEWKSIGGQLMDGHHLFTIDANSTRPALFEVQDNHPDSLLFSFGIAEQYTRQEKILKLLASGSIEADGSLLDLSMLYDLMGPQQPVRDLPQQPFASYPRWCFDDAESHQSLIYPTRELYFNEPSLELAGDRGCCTENMYNPDCQLQLQCNCIGNEMNDILSVISDFHLSKNTVKSSKQTMLVPYFERRKRVRSNTDSLKLATEKVAPLKSHAKVKEKTSSQKRRASTRNSKKTDIYCNSYLHACESLLSIIVNRKQQGNSTILSVKKSGPQLPQLLTQFSATIAGTGIAVVLSVACRVACGLVPFCGSKLFSTGLGLGLVWLSWAVNKLRDTVISIGKSSGKSGAREEEMMNHLDRNLKDIYFRAAALMAVVVLRLA
ncbi:hypothetical protein Salat_0504800 [Sesamum alatum]|uniref:Uncharacterized protein n=1 Tax=Sesamum alatum TaxID=300844 RepID=A0AAE1Z4K1_9LAMI|nr:hypothetical protein Salat_0504800 [Sesamum alatum]